MTPDESLEQEAIRRVQSLFAPLVPAEPTPPARVAPPVSEAAPKKPARIPFDPSYPAHLKVLLSTLVRSVEPTQLGAFSQALGNCLDLLLRYCTGVSVGALQQAGGLTLPVENVAPSTAETLKLLRYAVFAWESRPTHPMRRLLRSCFFEPGDVPSPLPHTRWLGVAGYPLESGVSVEDLDRWPEVSARMREVRAEYVDLLAGWLRAVRPMFMHLGRQYHVDGPRVQIQLSLQGQTFPMLPPWPERPWGLEFGAARLDEIERAQGLPGPAPEPVLELTVPPEAPGMPAHLRVLLARARDYAHRRQTEPLARTVVQTLQFLLGFSSSLTAGALAPLEEPGRTLAQPGGDPLRLLHYSVFALAQKLNHPLRIKLQSIYFAGSPPAPRLHTRWLGIAGTSPGLDNLAQWQQRTGPVAPAALVSLLEVLAEWLRALREIFAEGQLQVLASDAHSLALEASLDGHPLSLTPPIALGPLDFELSPEELAREASDPFWEPERFTDTPPSTPAGVSSTPSEPALEPPPPLPELPPTPVEELPPAEEPKPPAVEEPAVGSARLSGRIASTPSAHALGPPPLEPPALLPPPPLEELPPPPVEEPPPAEEPAAPAVEEPGPAAPAVEEPPPLPPPPFEELPQPTVEEPPPAEEPPAPVEEPTPAPVEEPTPLSSGIALEVASLRLQPWPLEVRAGLEKRAVEQEQQNPPLFLVEEALEYLQMRESQALLIEGAPGVGKTYAARALAMWPSSDPRPLIHFEWTPTHPLERLNEELNALELGLGADVIADLNRVHSGMAARWRAFFSTLMLRNPQGLTLVLDDPQPEALEYLPEGLQMVVCQREAAGLGVRLPIHHEHAGYQRYAVGHVQQLAPFLDAGRAQSLVEHCGSRLDQARLLAEGLVANLLPRTQWPQPLEPSLLMALGSPARTLLLVLAAFEPGAAEAGLLELLGVSPEAFDVVVPGVLIRRGPLRLQLATSDLGRRLKELLPAPWRSMCAQLSRRALELVESDQALTLPVHLVWEWALQADDAEHLGRLAGSAAVRQWREAACAEFDALGLAHRKIDILDGWLAVLERLLEANQTQHYEALAWGFSSRGLTWLGLGMLEPALADVERALAWFRELVEGQGHDALINGLAAASNRRSEILRSLGQLEEAAQDATAAIRAYTVAVEKHQRQDLEPLLALAYHNRAGVNRLRGQLDAAEADATRAIELYRPWVDKLSHRVLLDLARTYQTRALLALDREDGVQARDDAQRAIDVMTRLQQGPGDRRIDSARSLRLRAEAHYRMAEFATAVPDYDAAVALWRPLVAEGRLDLRADLTRDLCRQASAYARLDEQESALSAFQEAMDLSRQLVELEGRTDLAELLGQALAGRAEILAGFGLASEAAGDLLAALEQFTHSPGSERARTLTRLGELELELGEPLQAAGHLEQAELLLADSEEPAPTREAYRSTGLRERRARTLGLLGQAHRETGAHASAGRAFDRAVELYGQLVDEEGRHDLMPGLAQAHLGRAQALSHEGSFESAQADATQAVELLSYLCEGGSAELAGSLAQAWWLKAEIHGRQGQLEAALQGWDRALEQYRYLLGEQGLSHHQVDLARCYQARARTLSAAGQSAPALENLGLALTHFEASLELGEEDQRRWGECLLDRSRENLAAGLVEAGVADALAALDKTVGLDDTGALESLLDSLEGRAQECLSSEQNAEAAAGFTQVIEICQVLEERVPGADLRAVQSRAHQGRAQARRNQGLLDLACQDLTWSLTHLAQLAGLEGGDPVWAEQARLFEQRAELQRELGASERATLDLGRSLEASRRLRQPAEPAALAAFERRQASLYVERADLCRARGDLAESWQDLTVANAILLAQVALPEMEVQRLLARASIGLADTIRLMGRSLEAGEEYLRAARLLKKLSAASPEFQALQTHCLLERLTLVEPAELTAALTEAVTALVPLAQTWSERAPVEAVRQTLEGESEPDRALRLGRAWLALLESWPEGPESWAELLVLVLAQAERHSPEAERELAARVARVLVRRGATLTQPGASAPRPWVGGCFGTLARIAEGLEEGPQRQALRELGESWSAYSAQLLAIAGIMPPHLDTLCSGC